MEIFKLFEVEFLEVIFNQIIYGLFKEFSINKISTKRKMKTANITK